VLSLSLAALVTAAAAVTPARAGDPSRELVVQLSPLAAGATPLGAGAHGAIPAAVQRRFASLGLRATRAFGEQLAPYAQLEASPGRAAALPEIYAFHPERIVLVEAPDAALARSALAALDSDALVDWAEPNVTRLLTLVGYGAPANARRSFAAT